MLPLVLFGIAAIGIGSTIVAALSDDDDKKVDEKPKKTEPQKSTQASLEYTSDDDDYDDYEERLEELREYICDEFDARFNEDDDTFKSKELKKLNKKINKLEEQKMAYVELKNKIDDILKKI